MLFKPKLGQTSIRTVHDTVLCRNFGLSKIKIVGCNLVSSKTTFFARNFLMSKTTIVDCNFSPSKIMLVQCKFGCQSIKFGPKSQVYIVLA